MVRMMGMMVEAPAVRALHRMSVEGGGGEEEKEECRKK